MSTNISFPSHPFLPLSLCVGVYSSGVCVQTWARVFREGDSSLDHISHHYIVMLERVHWRSRGGRIMWSQCVGAPLLQVTWLSSLSRCFTWAGKEGFLPPEVLQWFHSINSLWQPPQAHITIPSGCSHARLHPLSPHLCCSNAVKQQIAQFDPGRDLCELFNSTLVVWSEFKATCVCDRDLTSQHLTRSVSSCPAGIMWLVWDIDTEKRAGNSHPSIHHVPASEL